MTDALAWATQHNGAAGQVDALNQRRGTDQKADLAGAEQPFDLKADQGGHIAIVEGDTAFDERCQFELGMHALSSEISQLEKLGVGWTGRRKQLAD